MKNKIIILLILSLFFTSGCSYKEMNDLSIVSAIGIDYIDNKYVVSVQVMDLKKETNDSTSESSVLYVGSGISLSDALKNIHLEYPNTLYLGHTELIVIGKTIIKNNNIDKTFDYFLRDPKARTDALIIGSITFDAKDILNPTDENNKGTFPSKDLISTIKNSKEITGYVLEESLEEFIINYYKEGITPVITSVTLDNNKTTLDGLISFNKNKYVDKLDYDNSFIYNLINNNIKNALVNIEYDNSTLNLELNSNTKINLKIENNKLIYDINIVNETLVTELHTDINFNTDKDYKTLEDITNNYIKEKVNNLIKYSIDNDTDLLGLRNILYKYKYKEYDKYKDNIYNKSIININVDTNIYRYGNISKGEKYES